MLDNFHLFLFLDPRPTEDPIKSPLSVCLSARNFDIFLAMCQFFSDFLHDDG